MLIPVVSPPQELMLRTYLWAVTLFDASYTAPFPSLQRGPAPAAVISLSDVVQLHLLLCSVASTRASDYHTNRNMSAAAEEDPFQGVEIIVERDLGDIHEPLWRGGAAASSASENVEEHGPASGSAVARITAAPSTSTTSGAASSGSFLDLILSNPNRQRVLCVIGGHLHGKTSLLRVLSPVAPDCPYRRFSTHNAVVGVVASAGAVGPSQHFTFLDTPGTAALDAEARCAIRLSDTVVVCIDVVEGLLPSTELLLRYAILTTRRYVVCFTKMDRLWLELRLPPSAAYGKLKHMVDSLNVVIASCGHASKTVEPWQLVFTSARYQLAFTLKSFARMYAEEVARTQQQVSSKSRRAEHRCVDGEVDDDAEENVEEENEASEGGAGAARSVQFHSVVGFTVEQLASKLWGPWHYHPKQHQFVASPPGTGAAASSFVQFVLEPLYKMFTSAMTHPDLEDTTLRETISRSMVTRFGAPKASVLEACAAGCPGAGVEAAVVLPIPRRRALLSEIERMGQQLREEEQATYSADSNGGGVVVSSIWQSHPATMNRLRGSKVVAECSFITVLHNTMYVATRVYFGTLKRGQRVKACWTSNVAEMCTVDEIFVLLEGTTLVPRQEASLGALVLIKSPSLVAHFHKMLLLVDETSDPPEFTPPAVTSTAAASESTSTSGTNASMMLQSFVRVALEPKVATDRRVMEEALKVLTGKYISTNLVVEPTGEMVLEGPTEGALDIALFDLRRHILTGGTGVTSSLGAGGISSFSVITSGVAKEAAGMPSALSTSTSRRQVHVRLSDPFVSLRETVAVNQGVLRKASTADVEMEMTAGRLHSQLGRLLDHGVISGASVPSARASLLRVLQEHEWDALDCQRILGFGPHAARGPNVIINDLLEDEMVDDNFVHYQAPHHGGGILQGAAGLLHRDVANSLVSSFQQATQRGPLCGEPMREVTFRLIRARFGGSGGAGPGAGGAAPPSRMPRETIFATGQITKQLIHSSMLSAAPALMEPVASVDILVPISKMDDVASVLLKRRGQVTLEQKIPATPLCLLRSIVPFADTFGLETEMRIVTQGAAQVSTRFDHWSVVPGDPLDATVMLKPLQAAHGYQLARDFLLKTRRRKGMSVDVELK